MARLFRSVARLPFVFARILPDEFSGDPDRLIGSGRRLKASSTRKQLRQLVQSGLEIFPAPGWSLRVQAPVGTDGLGLRIRRLGRAPQTVQGRGTHFERAGEMLPVSRGTYLHHLARQFDDFSGRCQDLLRPVYFQLHDGEHDQPRDEVVLVLPRVAARQPAPQRDHLGHQRQRLVEPLQAHSYARCSAQDMDEGALVLGRVL